MFTYLVIRQKSPGPGRVPRLAAAVSRRVQVVVLTCRQRKRLTVHRHTHHQFPRVRALAHPIVQREVLKITFSFTLIVGVEHARFRPIISIGTKRTTIKRGKQGTRFRCAIRCGWASSRPTVSCCARNLNAMINYCSRKKKKKAILIEFRRIQQQL